MPRRHLPTRQPRVTLTDGFVRWLAEHFHPEQLGEAWECARRCTETYDPDRRHKGVSVLFRTYFLNRWRFRKIDLKREESGRRGRNTRFSSQRFKVLRAYTNAPIYRLKNHASKRDDSVEQLDAIDFYRRQCRTRREALLVDCVSSGLTYRETGAALGVGESRVSQLLADMRFITVARTV